LKALAHVDRELQTILIKHRYAGLRTDEALVEIKALFSMEENQK
jgi:hypothetical protein